MVPYVNEPERPQLRRPDDSMTVVALGMPDRVMGGIRRPEGPSDLSACLAQAGVMMGGQPPPRTVGAHGGRLVGALSSVKDKASRAGPR
jgi:hypothetical protein